MFRFWLKPVYHYSLWFFFNNKSCFMNDFEWNMTLPLGWFFYQHYQRSLLYTVEIKILKVEHLVILPLLFVLHYLSTWRKCTLKGHSNKKVCKSIAFNYRLGPNLGPPTYVKIFKIASRKATIFVMSVFTTHNLQDLTTFRFQICMSDAVVRCVPCPWS
jgi:hypothetical protein